MRMGGRAVAVRGRCRARVPALVAAADRGGRGLARLPHLRRQRRRSTPQAIIETQAATLALAARLADEAGARAAAGQSGRRLRHSLFRGRHAARRRGDRRGAGAMRSRRGRRSSADTRFAIELGRWLVGEAGVYLTRVVDRKESRRRDLPGRRRRAPPPARGERQFRHGRAPQLSARGRRARSARAADGDGHRRRPAVHPARPARRPRRAAARRGRRRRSRSSWPAPMARPPARRRSSAIRAPREMLVGPTRPAS